MIRTETMSWLGALTTGLALAATLSCNTEDRFSPLDAPPQPLDAAGPDAGPDADRGDAAREVGDADDPQVDASCTPMSQAEACRGRSCGGVRIEACGGVVDYACGECGDFEACREPDGVCTCASDAEQSACGAGVCGAVELPGACAGAVAECGGCASETQICSSNRCVAPLVIAPPSELEGDNTQFGNAVALGGGFLVVGAPHTDDKEGAFATYQWSESTKTYEHVSITRSSSSRKDDRLGIRLALDTSTPKPRLLAARLGPQSRMSEAILYLWDASLNTWVEMTSVSASSPISRQLSTIGLAWSQGEAFIGEILLNPGDETGIVSRYDVASSTQSAFALRGRESKDNRMFGYSLDADASLIVAGAPTLRVQSNVRPRVYLFARSAFLASDPPTLVSLDAGDVPAVGDTAAFGASVALLNSALAVGSPATDVISGSINQGVVVLYERAALVSGMMVNTTIIEGPSVGGMSPENLHFGYSLAARGDLLLVGAPGRSALTDKVGMSSGAFLYDVSQLSDPPAPIMSSTNALAPGTHVGRSVAVGDDGFAAGAIPIENSGNSGAVLVWRVPAP